MAASRLQDRRHIWRYDRTEHRACLISHNDITLKYDIIAYNSIKEDFFSHDYCQVGINLYCVPVFRAMVSVQFRRGGG